MSIHLSDELVDQLLKENPNPGELFGDTGLIKHLTKRLVERALEGEMVEHLGYQKHAPEGRNKGNSRNGKTTKNVSGDFGTTTIEIPRDRDGTFEPQIVKKGQRRLDGFSQKVISLYGRGLSTREIQGHLKEIYGADVSPTVISKVTDVIEEDVIAWRNRPLESVYPVVYLDAMFIKIR
jgi:transposase-like protein